MTNAQLLENVKLSLTIPKGAVYKRPAFGHRFDELTNSEITKNLTIRAEDYAREALRWLMDTGRATTITASAVFDASNRLRVTVEVVSTEGIPVTFSRFVEIADV